MRHTTTHVTTMKSDEAVAGIIVAVMIIGLLLAVISIVQMVYIPKWMESREAEHMDMVADQFCQLKYACDVQSILRLPLPVSKSITLGSKELGFLTSSKALGELFIEEQANTIGITQNPGADSIDESFALLRYSSSNQYYLDQTYVYELGAILLKQTQGMVMSMTPSMTFTETDDNKLYCNFSFVNLTTIGGKISINGHGTYPVRIEYTSTQTLGLTNVDSITITTQHPSLWKNYLENSLPQGSVTIHDDHVTIDNFIGLNVIVKLQITNIEIQFAPGWVETQ